MKHAKVTAKIFPSAFVKGAKAPDQESASYPHPEGWGYKETKYKLDDKVASCPG